MDIYLEESREIILIRQKWKYNWMVQDASPWTYKEKEDFHKKADNIIWNTWSNKFKVRTRGTSELAKKFSNKSLTINFDIQWVIQNAHWNVNVIKVPHNKSSPTSSIRWNQREVNLDTKDTLLTFRKNNFSQFPVAHEFGHTIGNSYWALKNIGNRRPRGDEYSKQAHLNGGFEFDKHSIMNVGDQLRDRHIEYILYELNLSIKDTSFYFYSL